MDDSVRSFYVGHDDLRFTAQIVRQYTIILEEETVVEGPDAIGGQYLSGIAAPMRDVVE